MPPPDEIRLKHLKRLRIRGAPSTIPGSTGFVGSYDAEVETWLDEPQPVRKKKDVTVPAPAPKKKKATGPSKMFVLDTNVLMHDPMSLFRLCLEER